MDGDECAEVTEMMGVIRYNRKRTLSGAVDKRRRRLVG